MDITELLAFSAKNGASDLHLSAGMPPLIRVDGEVRRINLPALEHKEVHKLVYDIMNDKQRRDYEDNLETDFSFEVPGVARFRVNAFNQNRGAGAVFRTIPSKVLTIEDLGMGQIFRDICDYPRGLVLVTGPTGSGKSTTLAAMLDFRNRHKSGHIVCIEDPIEFLHRHQRSIIDQREVGLDTHSFADALRNVLREAPDVIMLGEIRDAATMQHALHYAETGHLCVATLHATSSSHAIERIARFFPDDARKQVLADVAHNLLAVIGQRLVPGIAQKRVAAVELMLGTPYIRDLIQRDELEQLREATARAAEQGLQTFDQHLFALLETGRISLAEALKFADSRTDLSLKFKLERGFSADDAELKVLRDG